MLHSDEKLWNSSFETQGGKRSRKWKTLKLKALSDYQAVPHSVLIKHLTNGLFQRWICHKLPFIFCIFIASKARNVFFMNQVQNIVIKLPLQ